MFFDDLKKDFLAGKIPRAACAWPPREAGEGIKPEINRRI